MAETLKSFEEGEDILASETNSNNQYLLSKLSDNAAQVQNYVEGQVASIKSNVATVQSTLQGNIDKANENANSKISATISKATNGYCELSNGLIMQWGVTSSMNAFSSKTVAFPTSFSATPCVTVACRQTVGEVGEVVACLGAVNTKSFVVAVKRISGLNTDGGPVNWIAIGY